MSKGRVWPAEWSVYEDRTTGLPVRQLTHCLPSRNVQFYFTDPCFSADGRWLVFTSDRSGRFELFGMRMESGEIVQLTDTGTAGGWVSRQRAEVFFWAGREVRAVSLDTHEERTIGVVTDCAPTGTPSENADGSLLAFPGKTENGHAIYTMRVSDGEVSPIWTTAGRPNHVQCSPVDADLIMHCDSTVPDGKPKHRVWLISSDGSRHWHPYTETPQEWLTHEAWMGRTGKLTVTTWPIGFLEITPDGSESRLVAAINAWYAVASPDGAYCVVNTNWPDRGIFLVETSTGRMCRLHDSCNAPVEEHVFHAQPNPTFSPDGKHVLFASEWQGTAELYLMEIAPVMEITHALARQERWWKPEYHWHRE